MDINFLRAAVTLFGLALFVGIAVWAWRRERRPAFDEAARLPFEDKHTGAGQ